MVLFIDDIRKDLAMKKTWIVWLTCLALTMSLLGGCASKPEETTDVAQEDTAAEEIQEETSQEETVQEESETAPADPVPEEEPGTGEQTAQTPAQTPEETPQQPSQTPAQTPPQPAQEPAPETQPAQAEEPAPAPEEPEGIADGTYTISISFSGGTGKASITSPVTLYVKGGSYSAKVVWTSVNYDYMIVNGTKYLNENVGGNSTFTIPVPALDTYFNVIGDTTAMSTPHEIEYTLYFDSTTIH